MLDSIRCTRHILETHNKKPDLQKFASESKNLTEEEQEMLNNLLSKYEFLFDGTLGTWKNKTIYIYRITTRTQAVPLETISSAKGTKIRLQEGSGKYFTTRGT